MSARRRHVLPGALLAGLLGGAIAACGGPAGTDSETLPKAETPPVVETLPASRGGQDLVGRAFPELVFDAWIAVDGQAADAESTPGDGLAGGTPGRLTLYRWWTDTCPYCASSLPALESLRRDYAGRGLRIVGVYHPKPPRASEPSAVREAARALGYSGLLAVDADWSELDRLYLSTGTRAATSASFLVDADGVIRFVHPGPEFHPSDDPQDAQEDADYRSIRRAVETLLD
jgi:thiol-disulfide isomerase/thioredoxin